MSNKKLSVITINYNNKKGLIKTIISVVNQSYKDFEFIVIDGGSTDGSLEVIKEYSSRIDLWVSEPDKGIYNAMNKGVAMANGDYCNFMNSGDSFFNEHVLRVVFSKNLNSDIFIGKAKTTHRVMLPPDNPTFNYFYSIKPLNHQAAFIKRDLLLKYPYDELNFKIVSDWKFFMEAFIVGNCTYNPIDEFIVNFDDTGFGSIDGNANKAEQLKVFSTLVYPRILEDYNQVKYLDTKMVRFSITIVRFFERFGKFLNPAKYFRKIKKLLTK